MSLRTGDHSAGRGRKRRAEAEALAQARAGRSPWTTFAVLALIEFMTVLDTSVVNVALPSIQHDLGFSVGGLAWVVDGYLLGLAGFLLLAGRAADLVGRRRLFIIGTVLFTVASLGCAMAVADWQLITARLVQGLGSALVIPSALALITDLFPEGPHRARALGIFTGMGGVAAAAGVLLGGLLTSVGWPWVFLVNVPIGAAVVVAGLRTLPATRPQAGGGLDLIGALTGTAGVTALTYAVTQGHVQGWTSAPMLVVLPLAVILLATFGIRQHTARAPLLPTELLRRRDLVLGNAIIALVGAVMIGTFFLITLYLQQVRGYTPLMTGVVYLPIPLAMLAGTQLAPRLLRRGPRNALLAGLAVQAAGLAWWAAAIGPDDHLVAEFLAPTALWSFGAGIALVSAFAACTTGVTGPIAGAASGMATTNQYVGGAIGLAALIAIATTGQTAAQVSGYAPALATAAGAALGAALLTRLIRPPMTHPRE